MTIFAAFKCSFQTLLVFSIIIKH